MSHPLTRKRNACSLVRPHAGHGRMSSSCAAMCDECACKELVLILTDCVPGRSAATRTLDCVVVRCRPGTAPVCGGPGSGDCAPAPAGPPDLSYPPAAVSARRRRTGRPDGRTDQGPTARGGRRGGSTGVDRHPWYHSPSFRSISGDVRADTTRVYAPLSRRENPDLEECARR